METINGGNGNDLLVDRGDSEVLMPSVGMTLFWPSH
jgi:hypothetical protein